jgi:hypothetical protein
VGRQGILLSMIVTLALGSPRARLDAQAPPLDAARRALHAGDTATAVATLNALVESDTVYDSQDVAALLLLRYIGHSPSQRAVQEVWEHAWPTLEGGSGTFRWESPVVRAAMWAVREIDRTLADVVVLKREHPILRGPEIMGTTRPRPWESLLRAFADTAARADSLLVAAVRWVAVTGWLANLNRFALEVPAITPPPGCEEGCLLARQPPPDLPLGERFRATGPAAAVLDTLWAVGNRAPAVGRNAMLDSLWVALHDLRSSPWPFNELTERLRVTVCALLRLGAEVSDCEPLTTGLDTVVAAELRAVRYEFDGHRRLAAKAMEAAPERFAALDRSVDLLLADSTIGFRTLYNVGGREFSEYERVPVASGPPPAWFWQVAWPLYLQPDNERLIAHRSRLILADMAQHFGVGEVPSLFDAWGEPGMLVRIGVPLALACPASQTGKQFPPVVYVAPGTHETLIRPSRGMQGVPLDFALAARGDLNPRAVSGFAAEDYDTFRPLDHQVVDYVRAGRHQVELYTRWDPSALCRSPRPRLGFFLLDSTLRRMAQPIEMDPRDPPRLKRFHLEPAPGSYVYSLELLDVSCRVAERARYVLTVPPVEAKPASDLMLVDELYFGDDRWVRRIPGRPPVTPRPSLTIQAAGVARFYWEVYGIAADSMETGRLRITFEVVNVHHQRVPVREIGRVAAAARRRAGTLDLRYDLTAPPGTEPLGFGLAVGIPEGTQGLHVARVRVTDTKTKRTVNAERAFFVR